MPSYVNAGFKVDFKVGFEIYMILSRVFVEYLLKFNIINNFRNVKIISSHVFSVSSELDSDSALCSWFHSNGEKLLK